MQPNEYINTQKIKIIKQETGESSRLKEPVHLSVQTMLCIEAGGHLVPSQFE